MTAIQVNECKKRMYDARDSSIVGSLTNANDETKIEQDV